MFCTQCGREVTNNDSFCGNCGNKITKKESKDLRPISLKVEDENCKKCDDILVSIYIGSPAKKDYSGDKKICVSCKVKDSKCPVCSLYLRTSKSQQCQHCFSSWNPKKGEKSLITPSIKNKRSEVKCPKCYSRNITANKAGFGLGKAVVGGVLTGGVGLLAGFLGSKKINISCLKCGHRWNPKK
tara:strand:- start:1350 stop:1901 length:552 start_codon:yes stop_codon:yes gene_type:complete